MPKALTKERINEIVKRYRPRGWKIVESKQRWEWSSAAVWSGNRTIYAPSLIDDDSLFLYLHEVGHVRLGHFDIDIPKHREEFAAECFAFHAFRAEGIPITKLIAEDAKTRIRIWIGRDTKKGIPIQHHIARWAKKKRRCRGSKSSR
jgi:hypothetical protein